MRRKKIYLLWVAALICGCIDLDLLDDMMPPDAGGPQRAEEEGESEAEPEGPPEVDAADTDPPQLVAPGCGGAERSEGDLCVVDGPFSAWFRFLTDEPSEAAISEQAGTQSVLLTEPWSTEHQVLVSGLSTELDTVVTIELSDINGNRQEIQASFLGLGGYTIAITEVLADPFGTEPDQEFVEIVNFGENDVDLSGWMLDDNGDRNGDLIPDGSVLTPGQVGVVVSPAYDGNQGQDPSPSSDSLMIILETSIGSNGLKNSEAETVELYDAEGTLVSHYGGQAGPPREGVSAVRRYAALPDDCGAAFVLEPGETSTPGFL